MNLIKEYDFDALPYIDKDYDIPEVRDSVHALIVAEMRSFAPANYLEYLPCPQLNLKSPVLKSELARVAKGGGAVKVDMTRYEALQPEGALENDLQAWKKSLSNIKSQFENQSNRLLNLELNEAHAAKVWLHHNKALEGTESYFLKQTEKLKTRIEEINLARKTSQENILPTLLQLNYKRDQVTFKCWQIQKRCEELEALCENKNITAAGLAAASSDISGSRKRDSELCAEGGTAKKNRVA